MFSARRPAAITGSSIVALAIVALTPAFAFAQSNSTTVTTATEVPATSPAPKAPQPPAPYRWSGVYFGGIIGFAWTKTDVTTVTTASGYLSPGMVTTINDEGAQTLRPNTATYGGEAGYDFQVARVVFGGSYDFSVMTMNDFVVSGTNYPGSASTFALTQTMETNWLTTARARAGWLASRRLLIFGTFGIAWMDLKYTAQFSDNLAAASESADFDDIVHGWIYGAGAEWRLLRTLSVKGEYLYCNFDPASTTSTNLKTTGGSFPGSVFTHTADAKLNVIQGSIKVRF